MPSITITFTAAEGTRIGAAYGAKLGLKQAATLAQVRDALVRGIKSTVRGHEAEQAARVAAVPADIELT